MADRRPTLQDVFDIAKDPHLSDQEKIVWILYRAYDRGDGAWPDDETLGSHMGGRSKRAIRGYRSALMKADEKAGRGPLLEQELRGPKDAAYHPVSLSKARQDLAALSDQRPAESCRPSEGKDRQNPAAQDPERAAESCPPNSLGRQKGRQKGRQNPATPPVPPLYGEYGKYGETTGVSTLQPSKPSVGGSEERREVVITPGEKREEHPDLRALWTSGLRDVVLDRWHHGHATIEFDRTSVGIGAEYFTLNDLLCFTDDPAMVAWMVQEAGRRLGWHDEPRTLRWLLRGENFAAAEAAYFEATPSEARGVVQGLGVEIRSMPGPEAERRREDLHRQLQEAQSA